jgi:hypothetical protein
MISSSARPGPIRRAAHHFGCSRTRSRPWRHEISGREHRTPSTPCAGICSHAIGPISGTRAAGPALRIVGGMPTTAMLRFSDARLNPQTKKIYPDRLARLGPSFPIPDEEEERRDSAGADIKIGAAMDEVRRGAKEKGVKSVHRENINFGAARNAFGLKPFGLGACATAVVGAILIRAPLSITPVDIVVAMAIVVIAAIWLLACTADRVRHALFEAIEGLVQAPRRSPQPRATTERRPKSA